MADKKDDEEVRVGFSCTVPTEVFNKLVELAKRNHCHWTQMVEKLIEKS